jgi:protein-disulfide isomerase
MSRLALRCFALAGLLATLLGAGPALLAQAPNQNVAREKIIPYVREHFHIPDTVKLTMTDLRESIYPDYLETTVKVDDGKEQHSQPLFVSRNMRYIVEGSLFNLGGDSPETALRLISLPDQPAQGPATAPVTLVEYSDLECPVCASLQAELETDIVPKYGNKLRVVFKEFPLVNVHEWALTGAIAAQCTYQINPSRYVAFRSAVYKNQESFNSQPARALLLHLGTEAGVDEAKLAACIDSRDSLSRVEANMNEGEALGVGQTPTSFINGRTVVGAPAATEFYKLIDEAMHDAK